MWFLLIYLFKMVSIFRGPLYTANVMLGGLVIRITCP